MYEYASTTKRIAVIVPDAARRGALRSAMALAHAIFLGAQSEGADVEIVLAHPDDPQFCNDEDMAGLPAAIKRRAFTWVALDRDMATRAMLYGGFPDWKPESPSYAAPDDGIKQLCDCDLWVLASDRVPHTLLPVRPSIVMKHAYIQRYDPMWRDDMDLPWLYTARQARAVLTTSSLAAQDVQNYGAVEKEKIFEVPLLIQQQSTPPLPRAAGKRDAFLWVANEAAHIDQTQVFDALIAYYQTYGGAFDCRVAGIAEPEQRIETEGDRHKDKRKREWPDLYKRLHEHKALSGRLTFLGPITDEMFANELAQAAFVLHTDLSDSESQTCLVSRQAGVPVLARDFPLMRALDEKFGLGLVWGARDNPRALARALKAMETSPEVPMLQSAAPPSLESVAMDYWKVVRTCL